MELCKFRRPLRVYLFELLLFLTVVTFAFQICYVFMPVFQNTNDATPMINEQQDRAVVGLKKHAHHVKERNVEANGKAPQNPKLKPAKSKQGKPEEKAHQEPADKAPQDRPRKAPQNQAKKAPEKSQQKASENNPQKALENQKRKIPQNQQRKAPQNQEKDAPQNHSQKAPQNLPQKAPQNLPQKAPQNQPQKAPQNQPQKAPQNQQQKSAQDPHKKASQKVKRKVPAKIDPNQLMTVDSKGGCLKKIMILGGMQIVQAWRELEDLVRILKQYPNENNVTYRMPLQCPAHKCTIELTFSSNFSGQMSGKDAVILGVAPYTLLNNMGSLLKKDQPRDQLWMLYGVETALRIHKWIKNIGQLNIHGMWSYLSTSGIHMPYAYYQPDKKTDEVRKPKQFWLKGKTKLLGWMGSNCAKEVFWPRMDFILDLQKHIQLDTYGKCGNLTCLPRLSEECKNLMSSYKFYLSVENAECNEYMSEKIWDTALQHGVVPIVYGARRVDYERLAPPNSFIYVGDFNSTQELAAYINKLDKRPDLYAKYFEWRYTGSVKQVYPNLDLNTFCDVIPFIDQVQKGELEKKPVSTFPWYNTCRNPITKPFNIKVDVPALQDWKPW